MTDEQIFENAKKDAKEGNYRPKLYDNSFRNGSQRLIYTKAFLAEREKMGLIGYAGPGK